MLIMHICIFVSFQYEFDFYESSMLKDCFSFLDYFFWGSTYDIYSASCLGENVQIRFFVVGNSL